MNKLIERIFYSFGTNLSMYKVSHELKALKSSLPSTFLSRDVTDIGCGDGKISLKLESILKPKSYMGIDLSPQLVSSARKRGLNAHLGDVENDSIMGDLGILWGVVHHFNTPRVTLKKIKKNFNSLIIRESVDDKRFFEMGYRFNKKTLIDLLNSSLNGSEIKIVEIKKTKSILAYVNTGEEANTSQNRNSLS